jgi:DNA-binding MarR family transcriptional regulator
MSNTLRLMRGAGVYDDALAEVGLKVNQFSLLNAVASREDTRPAELAKFLEMDESTLTPQCGAHVRKGTAPAGTWG